LLRHMTTMDTLAALGWSICSTVAGGSSHVEAPARLVAQHQNPAKMRTVVALLSHGYLPHSVASDSKLLETSCGLGTGGPAAPRHRGQQRARGRKEGFMNTKHNVPTALPSTGIRLLRDLLLAI